VVCIIATKDALRALLWRLKSRLNSLLFHNILAPETFRGYSARMPSPACAALTWFWCPVGDTSAGHCTGDADGLRSSGVVAATWAYVLWLSTTTDLVMQI